MWLNGAPDVTNIESASEDEIQEIIRYFDKIVSTIHPDSSEPPSAVHPSKLKLSEVTDVKQDLAQLLNRVQIHSKCSEAYCLRKDKDNPSGKKCRFNFPAPLLEISEIQLSDSDIKLITRRNHTHLNKYNPYIIQSWRANMDVSPVLSERALVNYLSKNISKSETKSKSLSDMIKSIIEDASGEKSAKYAIQRLFIKTCSERDFSAQETCHILMGTKLYCTGGRSFVSVNFNVSSEWIPVQNKNKYIRGSLLEKYRERSNLHNRCLWNMAKFHNVKRNGKQNIVMVYPKIVFNHKSPSNEEYYRQQCMLFLPWKVDESTLLANTHSWKDLYQDRIDEIKLNKGTSTPIEVDTTICNDDDVHVDPLLDLEDWMTLSRMGPNQLTQDIELGLRQSDLNFDWHSSFAKYQHYGGIPFLQSFIKQSKEEHHITENIASFPDINFSPDQLQIIKLAQLQTRALTNQPSECLPKRTIVQGKAGTGKSLVISAIVSTVIKEFGQDSILRLGPTGVSAVNINGATIHSKLRLSTRTKEFLPLQGIALHEYRKKLSNVKFVIVDEFSMVGCAMLHRIDERLRQATAKPDEEFGGLNIYLFGDVKQLAPIGDPAAYSTSQQSFEALKGKHLYDTFQTSVILKTIHRQQNEDFQRILNNISIGLVTKVDYDVLKSRFTTSVSPEERQQFLDAIHLYPKKIKVNLFNKNKLESLKDNQTNARLPVARIHAQHNCKLALEGSENEAEGLLPTLYLGKNAQIMLRANLWTQQGLVNGSLGTIVDLVYHPDASPSYDAPAVLICKFDGYKGPYLDEELKTVPIVAINKSWTKNGQSCTRVQFPITLFYATSIHKSQGLTLDKVFVDIGDNKDEKPGLTYVALSRAKSLSGLLLQPFSFSRLQLLNKSKSIQLKKNWEQIISRKQIQF